MPHLQIINTFLKNDMIILKQNVWKNAQILVGQVVLDQNRQNIVLINNSRTAWLTKIVMPFLSVSDNLLRDNYIIKKKEKKVICFPC